MMCGGFSPHLVFIVLYSYRFNSFHVGEITQGRILFQLSFSPLWFFLFVVLIVVIQFR